MLRAYCVILDANKNILGSTSADERVSIGPNISVTCKNSISLNNYPDAKYIRIDSGAYDGDGDSFIHEFEFNEKDIEKTIIEIK